jgi:predicted aspartyl protease
MGRIMASITVTNERDPTKSIRCDALVDTGASLLVLPLAWRDRLGELDLLGTVEAETATQERIQVEVRGGIRLQIEGFRPIATEVAFVPMQSDNGEYEALLGHIPLQQAQAAVDLHGHRLLHVPTLDLK